MSPRRSPGDREIARRAADLVVTIRRDLVAAAEAYSIMSVADWPVMEGEWSQAWPWVERLAERFREAEEMGLEVLEEDFLSSEALAVFAAVEDSFVLALSEDEELQDLRLSAEELSDRFEAVLKEETWGG